MRHHFNTNIFLICAVLAIASCQPAVRDIDTDPYLIHPPYPQEVPCNCYEVIAGDKGLDSVIIRQVDSSRAYFRNGNYLYFGMDSDTLYKYNPWSHIENLPIDSQLFNDFLFVFTAKKSSQILAYVKQVKPIPMDVDTTLGIMDEDLRAVLVAGGYDIYAFHNAEIVAKGSFLLTPEWWHKQR